MKFCKVEDPVNRRFESVVRPAVAFNVPVKFAALLIVCPLIRPDVIACAVNEPMFPEFANRFVVDALFEAYRFVVVAFVVVAFMPVKF